MLNIYNKECIRYDVNVLYLYTLYIYNNFLTIIIFNALSLFCVTKYFAIYYIKYYQ